MLSLARPETRHGQPFARHQMRKPMYGLNLVAAEMSQNVQQMRGYDAAG